MKTKQFISVLTLTALCLLASCKQEQKEETTASKVKVKTVQAQLEPVESVSTYTATVKADVINQITPAMPGRIEKIYVEIGGRVQKGQLLVQMESSNLRQQNIQLANLERDYDRYAELLKVGGIAQQQVDQVKTQIDALKTAIKNLQDNTQLLSPISGTVTARNYDNGDVFAQMPILTVQQLNPLKAVVNVSESLFAKVQPGMPVNIRLDVYGDELFTGKITLIYPTIDAATHTFGVEVTIPNSDLKVRPGMYARVSLNLGTNESIVVPDAAIQRQPGANDKYVYLIENGVARYSKVQLGQHLNERYEILSGVKPGDAVVIAGQARLIDGTEVEIIHE